jgi:hypothetical protein
MQQPFARGFAAEPLLVAIALTSASCSYDFDRFARPGGRAGENAQGGAVGDTTGGLGGVGDGGTPSGSGGSFSARGGGGMAGTAAPTGGTGGEASDAGPTDASSDGGGSYCDAVGGTVYQGHCYVISPLWAQWSAAQTNCENLGSFHLVTITSAEEQAVVVRLMIPPADSGPGMDYWIGLSEPAGTSSQKKESNFGWVTAPAEHYDPSAAGTYRNWGTWTDADVEPNFTGDCVRVRYLDPMVSGRVGSWADCQCTDALPSICEHE